MSNDGVRVFESTQTEPHARGVEFGRANAAAVLRTVSHYRELFTSRGLGADELQDLSVRALSAITDYAPAVASEIAGIAQGAGAADSEIAMINARTEILAHAGIHTAPECSTVVQLSDDGVVAQQNWDWYTIFEEDWLVWRFTTDSGVTVETMTEYGVVAKAGCNSTGVGVLFNILHHDTDGRTIGAPVHVIARRVLTEAVDVASALTIIAAARRSASTTMTVVSGGPGNAAVAVSVEIAPDDLGYVFADDTGLLLHTNHFLSSPLSLGDREHREYPDTVLRYDALRRRLGGPGEVGAAEVAAALSDTTGGPLALCCRPDPNLPGDFQYQTLAHIDLDIAEGRLNVTPFGPPGSNTKSPRKEETHHV
ncbi:MAG: C45 family peptidase [Mycobacterium sp.]